MSHFPNTRRVRSIACLCAGLLSWQFAAARGLEVVVDGAGDAAVVVALYAADGAALGVAARDRTTHVVDQVNKRFVPALTAITVGDAVSFPNSDDIRHHVYSFSPAKTFELPLYHGVPTAPVDFDVAGKVVLGCNIHDSMAATIYVLDTAVHTLTIDGIARFPDLAAGDYRVVIHHPRQVNDDGARRFAVHVDADAPARLDIGISLASPPAPELSALEARFKALRDEP